MVNTGSTATSTPAMHNRQAICAARSKVDAILAGPPVTPMVPILREPVYKRDPMLQARDARGRLNPGTFHAKPVVLREETPAELHLGEAPNMDLRGESSRADRNLRLSRLAGRAAAIIEQIARERAASDARASACQDPLLAQPGQPTPRRALIPSQTWDQPSAPAAAACTTSAEGTVSRGVAADQEPGVTRTDAEAVAGEVASTIRLLGSLRLEGLLTEAEFTDKKTELLARL